MLLLSQCISPTPSELETRQSWRPPDTTQGARHPHCQPDKPILQLLNLPTHLTIETCQGSANFSLRRSFPVYFSPSVTPSCSSMQHRKLTVCVGPSPCTSCHPHPPSGSLRQQRKLLVCVRRSPALLATRNSIALAQA